MYTSKNHLSGIPKLSSSTIYQFACDITAGPLGNIYLAGAADSLPKSLAEEIFQHAWLAKVGIYGQMRWFSPIYDTSTRFIYGLATDIWGNVYVAAGSHDAEVTETKRSDLSITCSIAKYNKEGVPIWHKEVPDLKTFHLQGIVAEREGNLYISGTGPSSKTQRENGWLARFNPEGDLLWVGQIEIPESFTCCSLSIDLTGEFIDMSFCHEEEAQKTCPTHHCKVFRFNQTGDWVPSPSTDYQ